MTITQGSFRGDSQAKKRKAGTELITMYACRKSYTKREHLDRACIEFIQVFYCIIFYPIVCYFFRGKVILGFLTPCARFNSEARFSDNWWKKWGALQLHVITVMPRVLRHCSSPRSTFIWFVPRFRATYRYQAVA